MGPDGVVGDLNRDFPDTPILNPEWNPDFGQ